MLNSLAKSLVTHVSSTIRQSLYEINKTPTGTKRVPILVKIEFE